jgi:hypothetical protein
MDLVDHGDVTCAYGSSEIAHVSRRRQLELTRREQMRRHIREWPTAERRAPGLFCPLETV